MTINPRLIEITERIKKRSANSRAAYEKMIADMRSEG